MSLPKCLIAGLLLGSSLLPSLVAATASFDGNTLAMPYVVVGDDLYDVNLVYVQNSNPVEFTLGTFFMHADGTDVPENSAGYSNNILSIPTLQINTDSYQLQLDYIAADGVFRLLETPVLLTVTDIEYSLSQWMLNTNDERSANIFDSGSASGVLVNIESVEIVEVDGESFAHVIASGIPNYSVTLTQAQLDTLNARPNAATDFADGATTVGVGDVILFGDDIGYNSSTENCNATGGAGFWPPGPGCPVNDDKDGFFPLQPQPGEEACESGLGALGYFVNGTSIFNWKDGQSYDGAGIWQNIAMAAEVHDLDICLGHAANGEYHHHSYSSCLGEQLDDGGDGHSPVYGYAADGYPVHGPWYSAGVLVKSSWAVRDYDNPNSDTGCGMPNERSCLLVDQYDISLGTVAADGSGPNTNDSVNSLSGNSISAESGLYFEDYYNDISLLALGDEYIDQYGGHDHGGLGYHYHMPVTQDEDGSLIPVFPFTIGPNLYGELKDNGVTSCSVAAGQDGGDPPGGGPTPGGGPPPPG